MGMGMGEEEEEEEGELFVQEQKEMSVEGLSVIAMTEISRSQAFRAVTNLRAIECLDIIKVRKVYLLEAGH